MRHPFSGQICFVADTLAALAVHKQRAQLFQRRFVSALAALVPVCFMLGAKRLDRAALLALHNQKAPVRPLVCVRVGAFPSVTGTKHPLHAAAAPVLPVGCGPPLRVGRAALAVQRHHLPGGCILQEYLAALHIRPERAALAHPAHYKVLGGSVNQIVTDMTVGIDTPEAMAAEARERVEKDGFTILKIKAGINPSEDIQALTLIRQAVGPNIRLRVDANQGYTVSDAVRTLKAFEELGVEAVEQCLPSWDLDGMRFVRSKVDLQVMLDESVHTPIDAAKACKIDAADIINIKLMKCGGLYPAEKINAIAEANHVQCMVGCMLETKVAIAAGVSLVAAKQNITEADCDSFMYAVDPEMGMPGGFAVNGGVYTLSDKPGLGIDIDF